MIEVLKQARDALGTVIAEQKHYNRYADDHLIDAIDNLRALITKLEQLLTRQD